MIETTPFTKAALLACLKVLFDAGQSALHLQPRARLQLCAHLGGAPLLGRRAQRILIANAQHGCGGGSAAWRAACQHALQQRALRTVGGACVGRGPVLRMRRVAGCAGRPRSSCGLAQAEGRRAVQPAIVGVCVQAAHEWVGAQRACRLLSRRCRLGRPGLCGGGRGNEQDFTLGWHRRAASRGTVLALPGSHDFVPLVVPRLRSRAGQHTCHLGALQGLLEVASLWLNLELGEWGIARTGAACWRVRGPRVCVHAVGVLLALFGGLLVLGALLPRSQRRPCSCARWLGTTWTCRWTQQRGGGCDLIVALLLIVLFLLDLVVRNLKVEVLAYILL